MGHPSFEKVLHYLLIEYFTNTKAQAVVAIATPEEQCKTQQSMKSAVPYTHLFILDIAFCHSRSRLDFWKQPEFQLLLQ